MQTLVAAVLCALVPQDPAPVALRHALVADTGFRFLIETDAKVELGDPRQHSRMRFCLHFAATVGPARGRHAEVRCRLDRIEADLHSPGANLVFDSGRHTPPGPIEPLARLLGETFVVRVDARGDIAGVELPRLLTEVAEAQVGGSFDTLFAAYFLPLPEAAIAVGQSWPSSLAIANVAALGTDLVQVDNRVTRLDGQRATIERTLVLPEPPQRRGVQFEVGKARGALVFAVDRGRLLDSELVIEARATRAATAAAPATTGTTTLRLRAALEPETEPAPAPLPANDR